MKVVGIVGFKKSGKTTLGVALSKALTEMGHRVSVIKHTHGELDLSGTDSGKYSRYAEMVAAGSAGQTEMIFQGERSLEDLLAYSGGGIVLAEGFKKERTYPRIVCLREAGERESLLKGLDICTASFDPTIADFDIVNPDHVQKMADLAIEKAFKLPNLDCAQCGYASCYDLAREIVKGRETPSSCPCLHPTMTLKIDGKPMALNDFSNALFRKTLLAMFPGPKGLKRGRIEIEIS